MLVDSHCHLTIRFEEHEIPNVLMRAADAGVGGVLLVGYDPPNYRAVAEILTKYGTGGGSIPALAGSIGIHPHEADNYSPADIEFFRDELKRDDIVAIGETGLDFFRDYADRNRQEEMYRAQIRLACETGYPIIIHSRSAFGR